MNIDDDDEHSYKPYGDCGGIALDCTAMWYIIQITSKLLSAYECLFKLFKKYLCGHVYTLNGFVCVCSWTAKSQLGHLAIRAPTTQTRAAVACCSKPHCRKLNGASVF